MRILITTDLHPSTNPEPATSQCRGGPFKKLVRSTPKSSQHRLVSVLNSYDSFETELIFDEELVQGRSGFMTQQHSFFHHHSEK